MRKAAVERKNPSNLSVTLTLSKGHALPPPKVRDWLEEVCGADMALYSAEKSLALKTLGYDDDGPEYVMTFSASSVDEIVECLLGQRELDASFGPPLRSRFGVKAEAPDELVLPPAGRVSATPRDCDPWVAEVLDEAGAPQASIELNGQTIAFEGLPREHWRSEATNDLIRISILRQSVTVKFLAAQLLDRTHSLDRLIRSVEFWLSLVSCGGRFRILKLNRYSPDMQIKGMTSNLDPVLERGLDLLKAARTLYAYCQIDSPTISYESLTERARQIIHAAQQLDLRQAADSWVICECRPENVEELAERLSGGVTLLMTFPVDLGDDILAFSVAYAVRPEWRGATLKLHATSRFPLRGCRLERNDPVKDYESFVAGIRGEVSPALHAHIPLIVIDAEPTAEAES
ncbi:MAG: hypothetical protein VR75_00680 [Hyphomonadaceae bacterium BRH_c29]|nr:MAG: hypothetical protein VR75_00680 [Hyphomonadaceae bacterium BRH_c29]